MGYIKLNGLVLDRVETEYSQLMRLYKYTDQAVHEYRIDVNTPTQNLERAIVIALREAQHRNLLSRDRALRGFNHLPQEDGLKCK